MKKLVLMAMVVGALAVSGCCATGKKCCGTCKTPPAAKCAACTADKACDKCAPAAAACATCKQTPCACKK